MAQQWVKLTRYIKDQILICELGVYKSGKPKSVTAEERVFIVMSIWLGIKIKNRQIHNLITFRKAEDLPWPQSFFLALKPSSVHRPAARDLMKPARACIASHIVRKSLRNGGEQ